MTREQILPTVLIIIDIGAALVYIPGNWWKAGYWFSAAVLTICVTFGRH
jgi:hypothetical protein